MYPAAIKGLPLCHLKNISAALLRKTVRLRSAQKGVRITGCLRRDHDCAADEIAVVWQTRFAVGAQANDDGCCVPDDHLCAAYPFRVEARRELSNLLVPREIVLAVVAL